MFDKMYFVFQTTFLLDYIKLMSTSSTQSDCKLSLKKYFEILLEVGDPELLLLNYHKIYFLLSKTKKVSILRKITTFCVENSYPIQNSQLLLSVDIDFK